MIGFARPTVEEERWLAVAAALGANRTPAEVTARAGGWRSTGLLARIAMFFLGLLAAALIAGVLSLGGTTTLLIAGLVAAFAAESLARGKRLFASGIEEGLCLGGWMLLAGWVLTLFDSFGFYAESFFPPVLIFTAAAAGLRLLNPFITAMASIAFVRWAGWNVAEWPVFGTVGAGIPTLAVGGMMALIALWLGGRQLQRPSHDRMLDWLVAALPITSYSGAAAWMALDPMYASSFAAGRWVTVVLLAALGSAMLIAGLRRRRHAPLLGFLGCLAGVAIELRVATGIATEAWLIGCGLLAMITGIALDRYLRKPRNGFTSQRLSVRKGPLDVLQTAGTAVLTHGGNTSAPQPETSVAGGGGRFGGGGASGSF
jgi:uncharacterized membrane protein YgcG